MFTVTWQRTDIYRKHVEIKYSIDGRRLPKFFFSGRGHWVGWFTFVIRTIYDSFHVWMHSTVYINVFMYCWQCDNKKEKYAVLILLHFNGVTWQLLHQTVCVIINSIDSSSGIVIIIIIYWQSFVLHSTWLKNKKKTLMPWIHNTDDLRFTHTAHLIGQYKTANSHRIDIEIDDNLKWQFPLYLFKSIFSACIQVT